MRSIKKTSQRILGFILAILMTVPGYAPVVYADTTKGEETNRKPALTLEGGKTSEKKEAFADDSVIVMFKDDAKLTKKTAKSILKSGDDPVADIKVEQVWNFDEAKGSKTKENENTSVALVSSEKMNGKTLLAKLEQRDDIKYAERNHKVHALKVSDDAYSDLQWSMQDGDLRPNVSYEWNEKGVTGSDEKIVAVVDTGVDYNHPDLKDNMWKNTHYSKLKGTCGYDFINGDGDPMDDNGHGTHCAGIIGAVGNNGTGISGVNQNIKIMALKILDFEGGSELSHEIAAYDYINKALDLGEPVAAINNSWGGGEGSDILRELIDIVGEKGAVTVCAAGNEALNNDEEPGYPADLDSEYIISVGAATRKGQLASFSNYGDSVDVAAPGADILSTVSYDSYLPTIYDDEEQSKLSEEYNGFNDDGNTWAEPSEDSLYVDGIPYKEYIKDFEGKKDAPEITCSRVDGDVLVDSGKHMEITVKNIPDDALITLPIPYKMQDDFTTPPHLSVMASVDAPESFDMFGSSLFGIVSTKADTPLTLDGIGEEYLEGFPVGGVQDDWNHVNAAAYPDSEPKAGEERQFAILLYAYTGGDYTIRLDDIGLSKQDIKSSDFGKYDIYSGTSMAAPYITGSVALKTIEKEQEAAESGEERDSTDVINEIVSMYSEPDPALKTGNGGLFDFRKVPLELGPRISRATVDTDTNEIKIWGSGFDPKDTEVKVEIGDINGNMKEAEIKEKTKKYIIVANDGWINNIEDIRVTAYGPKPSVKRDVYLVKGKKEYTEAEDSEIVLGPDALATDGNKIYSSYSTSGEISAVDPKNKEDEGYTVGTVDVESLFPMEKEKNVRYGLLLGKDLVYSNGMLYTIAEYGAAEEIESTEDDDWSFFSRRRRASYDDEDDFDDEEDEGFDGPYSIYSGETKLLKFNAAEEDGKAEATAELPKAISQSEAYTMAAYNGKLYFIGGHSFEEGDKGIVKTVTVYDPSKDEWSEGPELPEARYGGRALQWGDKLVYTLAEADDSNQEASIYDVFIFDGSKWETVKAENEPKMLTTEGYHDISVVKDGILFTGAAVTDYGDTFIFNVAEKKFEDTGFNFVKDPEDYGITAIALGDTLYGVDVEETVYTMPVESGFVKVTGSAKGSGKILGTGFVAPGNDAKITVKAGKFCHIKSLKLNSKKVKVKADQDKKVITINNPTQDQNVEAVFAKNKKVKVTVKKTGSGKVKGAKKYYVGQNVKLTVTAAKGNYIKSLKVGAKKVKLKGKTAKKVYTIKKIKKNTKVIVAFAKK